MKNFLKKSLMFWWKLFDEFGNSPWRIHQLSLTSLPVRQGEFFCLSIYMEVGVSTLHPIHLASFFAIICVCIFICFVIQSVAKDLVNIKRSGCYGDPSSLRSSGWQKEVWWIGWRVWEQTFMYICMRMDKIASLKIIATFANKPDYLCKTSYSYCFYFWLLPLVATRKP